jgi:hypothetical protein
MYAQLTDSDMVILNSLDSYLKATGMPSNITPDQMLIFKEQARWQLYSDIVQRVPRVASYIMHADLDTDERAQGLYKALANHCLDPKFVELLLQQLRKVNNPSDNGITGAFLAKVVSAYVEKHMNDNAQADIGTETKAKKGEKPAPEKTQNKDMCEEIRHVYDAAACLLQNIADAIVAKCGNLDNGEDKDGRNPMALGIAACIAMNNGDAISEIIASDAPVTADIFDILNDPSNIIRGALLLDKSKFTKLSKNQEEFINSLKRWVYKKLNELPTQQIYGFLVAVYGTVRPEKERYFNYLIQLKDCGTQYSNLLIVAKQMFNQ